MDPTDLILNGKLRSAEFRVCLDPDLVDEWEALQARQAAAREASRDSLAGGEVLDLQAQLDELAERMEAATLTLKLRALPRPEYRSMLDRHPPRKDPEGKLLHERDRGGVDYDGFYGELARASIVEPKLDAATLDVLLDEKLSDGQWEALTTEVAKLNRSTVDVPFSSAVSRSPRTSSPS